MEASLDLFNKDLSYYNKFDHYKFRGLDLRDKLSDVINDLNNESYLDAYCKMYYLFCEENIVSMWTNKENVNNLLVYGVDIIFNKINHETNNVYKSFDFYLDLNDGYIKQICVMQNTNENSLASTGIDVTKFEDIKQALVYIININEFEKFVISLYELYCYVKKESLLPNVKNINHILSVPVDIIAGEIHGDRGWIRQEINESKEKYKKCILQQIEKINPKTDLIEIKNSDIIHNVYTEAAIALGNYDYLKMRKIYNTYFDHLSLEQYISNIVEHFVISCIIPERLKQIEKYNL